jgi:hypothetical protein
MASFMVTLAMVAAWLSRRVPPNVPMAVLHAEAITTSFILISFLEFRVTKCKPRVTGCAMKISRRVHSEFGLPDFEIKYICVLHSTVFVKKLLQLVLMERIGEQ